MTKEARTSRTDELRSWLLLDILYYNTIQYKTCNVPCVTRMLFIGAGMTRD